MEEQKPSYRTNKAERALLAQIRKDFTTAEEQKNRGYEMLTHPVLGAMSVQQMVKQSRKLFDGYIAPPQGKPWKSKFVRSKVRKKVISSVAQTLSAGLGLDFAALNSKNPVHNSGDSWGYNTFICLIT